MERLRNLNPDALARLVAASEPDLTTSIALRREAASNLSQIADCFENAVVSLGQQQTLAQTLIDSDVSGREFIRAASTETESPFLIVTPSAQPDPLSDS